jgi:hypothetical protein
MEGMTKRHRFIRFTPSPALLAAKSPQSVLGYSSCHTARRTIGVPAWDETAKRRTDWIRDDDPADDMGRPADLRKLRKANFVARSGSSDWRSGCEGCENFCNGQGCRPVLCWHCLQDSNFWAEWCPKIRCACPGAIVGGPKGDCGNVGNIQ